MSKEGCLAASLVLVVVQLFSYLQDATVSAFMQSFYSDIVCKLCIVRVHNSHVSACFRSQICNFGCCHSIVESGRHLVDNDIDINIFSVKTG